LDDAINWQYTTLSLDAVNLPVFLSSKSRDWPIEMKSDICLHASCDESATDTAPSIDRDPWSTFPGEFNHGFVIGYGLTIP
tara:strand:- start:258 stop:500 length:243 start_codon:yes stop_codon:yes gene_type:complete